MITTTPRGKDPCDQFPINSCQDQEGEDFCGIRSRPAIPQDAEQSSKKNRGLFLAHWLCDMLRHGESGRIRSGLLRAMPRLGPCARNPDRYRAKAGPVPGAGPEADRDGLRASHPLAPDPGERLVRTLQAAGLIAALISAPVLADPVPDQAERLAVLCQAAIDAEKVIPGGSEIIWRKWVREAKPSPDQQAIQYQFCLRHFAAYDAAKERKARR